MVHIVRNSVFGGPCWVPPHLGKPSNENNNRKSNTDNSNTTDNTLIIRIVLAAVNVTVIF